MIDWPAPPHIAPLLIALSDEGRLSFDAWSESDWDRVLRMARSARLHAVLAERLRATDVETLLPPLVRAQLDAASNEATHVRHMLRHELDCVRAVLVPAKVDLIVLKGAAYELQGLQCAAGRLPGDLDILVRRDDLARTEQLLRHAGWMQDELDAYDERYYRGWTHQLPPLRVTGRPLELDVHHALLPPRGRHRIDTAALWDASLVTALDGVRVLAPEDQVLHAVVHLFFDSDCCNRLRDLIDIGALLDEYAARSPRFVDTLVDRAGQFGITASLLHAASFLYGWLGRSHFASGSADHAVRRVTRTLMAQRLSPPDPEGAPPCWDLAAAALRLRSLALRLPAHIALAHAWAKAVR
jgi:hypothetical protein